MNAMIERVAWAIYASRGSTIAFDDKSDWTQAEMRSYARAAIEAMREPPDAMVSAGHSAQFDLTKTARTTNEIIAGTFRAMIEEALK